MSRNRAGVLRKGNQEWGRKHRKHEDAERGLNNRARKQAIEEQLAELCTGECSPYTRAFHHAPDCERAA